MLLGGTPSDPARRSRPLTHSSTSKNATAAIPDLCHSTPEAVGSTVVRGPGKTHCLRPYFSTHPATHNAPLSTSKIPAEAIPKLEDLWVLVKGKDLRYTRSTGPAKTHCPRPYFSYPPAHAQPTSLIKQIPCRRYAHPAATKPTHQPR